MVKNMLSSETLVTYHGNCSLVLSIHQSPQAVTQKRASQPARSTTANRRQGKNNQRVKSHKLSTYCIYILGCKDLTAHRRGPEGGEDGRGKGIFSTRGAESEE